MGLTPPVSEEFNFADTQTGLEIRGCSGDLRLANYIVSSITALCWLPTLGLLMLFCQLLDV